MKINDTKYIPCVMCNKFFRYKGNNQRFCSSHCKNRLYIKQKYQELHTYYGNQCFVCGATKFLQFAHIKDTPITKKGAGRGMYNRVMDINKNRDCYRLLCFYHHKEFDNQSLGFDKWVKHWKKKFKGKK